MNEINVYLTSFNMNNSLYWFIDFNYRPGKSLQHILNTLDVKPIPDIISIRPFEIWDVFLVGVLQPSETHRFDPPVSLQEIN